MNTYEYTITGNKSKRTFTIREYYNGRLSSKYRTVKQSKNDFHYYSLFATQNDIKQLLRSGDCYLIK